LAVADSHFEGAARLRAKGPVTCQPRATPWVFDKKKIKALKERAIMRPPLQGFVFFERDTQGGARASLALGWLVCAPLVLVPDALGCAGQA
jgi:hypothetical protein